MILPIMILSSLLAILVDEGTEAASTRQRRMFDDSGNYIVDYRHPQDANCCIVPYCDGPDNCFGSISCGYVCSQGSYKPIDYGFTPGFVLKEKYKKIDCHFGLCQNYMFSCKHCPDPKSGDFNIYTVRRDCKDCYYKDG